MAQYTDKFVILTPAGVLESFSQAKPNEQQQALQAMLAPHTTLQADVWQERYSELWLEMFMEEGWVELVDKALNAPNIALDKFLPYVAASLSGTRRAAIGTGDQICMARIGFSQKEAQDLCIAASDFFEFVKRQQERNWAIHGNAVSFFQQVGMLMATVSVVFLWINGTGYWLVLEGEPLLNNRAFIELVWGIKATHERTLEPTVKTEDTPAVQA